MEDKIIKIDDIMKNHKLRTLIETAHRQLGVIGYTEHGFRHAAVVSDRSGKILAQLGKPKRTVELARIAGYMHDCGNAISRHDHARTGGIIAYDILNEIGMPIEEIAEVVSAIGNHHETYGLPVSDIAAATIIADKSDVHKSRVRKSGDVEHDIHDRVNHAVKRTNILVHSDERTLELSIVIDTEIASMMQYFETFLERMVLSRLASEYLGLTFELVINGTRLS
ncbi:MAG: HD domain-containing protein [Candidatus Zixiibacteriota bacterium]